MKSILFILIVAFLGCSVAQEHEFFGTFVLTKEFDVITDANKSYMWTLEVDAPGNRQGSLGFRCAENGLEIILNGDDYITSEGEIVVEAIVRFDTQQPIVGLWSQSTNRKGLFAWNSSKESLIKSFDVAKKFAMRFTNFEGTMYTYVFNLDGFTDAFDRLGCKNDLGG
jgi:hypothetical protein